MIGRDVMKLLLNSSNVIIDIADEMEAVSNGILVRGDIVYGEANLSIHEVMSIPQGVKPQRYKFVNGDFIVNEDYVEPINTEQEIRDLKDEVAFLWYELMKVGG